MLKDNLGKYQEAVETAERAITAAGPAGTFYFHMGNAQGKLEQFQMAEESFKEAIRLNPRNALFHVNLGVLYHRFKKYLDAQKSYLNALKIDPALSSAKQHYETVSKKIDMLKNREE